ncbi:MAG: HAMP domain-containing sensor histidine kinase [Planctomycetota bacterium]
MSIRRRMAIVFLLVIAVSVALLLGYLTFESRRIEKLFNKERQTVADRTGRLLGLIFKNDIESQLASALVKGGSNGLAGSSDDSFRDDPLSLAIDIGLLPYWDDDPLVRDHLDRAVLIRYTDTEGILPFNVRPQFMFEKGEDGFDPVKVRRLIAEAPLVVRDDFDAKGRRIVYGTIEKPGGNKNWGFYFRLKAPAPSSFDPRATIRALAWIIIPGTALLLAFLFFTFRQSVLEPLKALEAAALKTSQGDYETKVAFAERRDELGRVARAMNLMKAELLRYRQHMEGLVSDATDRIKNAEQHLVVAQRLAAMGRLAAGVAHEVNNPLGGMLNALKTLGRDDISDEKRERYLRLAEDGAQRIQVTVRRLLDTMPRGRKVAAFELSSLIDKAEALVMHRLETESVELLRDDAIDARVLVDAQEAVQVFLNLFINALDALKGKAGRIEVQARVEGKFVELRVSDNGVGMDEENRNQIFDLFFTTKPGTEGTGLGLAIVHNIITGHGGTLAVDSALGKGTAFRFTLPLAVSS